jgi:hypothetical protein
VAQLLAPFVLGERGMPNSATVKIRRDHPLDHFVRCAQRHFTAEIAEDTEEFEWGFLTNAGEDARIPTFRVWIDLLPCIYSDD